MMMRSKFLAVMLAVVLILGILVAVVSAQTETPTPTPAAARVRAGAPSTLADLLNEAIISEERITFDFIVPVVTGERVWTLPDDASKRVISAVGADYVCFSEPWNDGSRERCTPFSNISSVTFLR